ncbi:MAG: choice-of-anchor D domain-containing protein, partial [Verrucomicrobiae bacterium]|nr:choice-of-anchor D domain-containing protein [Verrucomicrobiae bacterium]
ADNDSPGSGAAYVLRRVAGTWSFEAILKASIFDQQDGFGDSVAIDGDTVLVGATGEGGIGADPADNSGGYVGAAYRFQRNAGVWGAGTYLKAAHPDSHDHFGNSVALSGSTGIVGALLEDGTATGVNGDETLNDDGDEGAAYIFENLANPQAAMAVEQPEFTRLTSNVSTVNFGLTVTGGDAQRDVIIRNFGSANLDTGSFVFAGPAAADYSVILSSATAIPPNLKGTVRIRFAPGTMGTKSATLHFTSNDPGQPSFIVRLTGTGVCLDTPGGPAASRIAQSTYVKASNTGSSDSFGVVAMSGNLMAIGAPKESSASPGVTNSGSATPAQEDNSLGASGAVYVFERNSVSDAWSQTAFLKASNPGADDRFGSAVAVSNNTVVVGADGDDGSGSGVNPPDTGFTSNSGAAYVFVKDSGAGTWSQQAYLKSSFPEADGRFGRSVAISDDRIVVGAPAEQVLSITQGVAYLFLREAGGWSAEAYLKDQDATGYESFGDAVAIDGDTIVVGEPGRAEGTNPQAGGALVFVRNPGAPLGEWSAAGVRLPGSGQFHAYFGSAVAIDSGSLDGTTVVVGEPGADGGDGSAVGRVFCYTSDTPGVWNPQAVLSPGNVTFF